MEAASSVYWRSGFPRDSIALVKALDELCKTTGTQPDDWQIIDGPDSRCGVDYWFQHAKSGKKAYVNDDQGHITVDCED